MQTRASKWVVFVGVVLVVGLPLAQAFRGLDLTDTGFLLTNQAWVFQDPQAVSYWFHLWLPNVLGGLVLALAAPVGVFASKLAATLLFWGLVWAVVRLYGTEIPRVWLLAGVAAGMAFDFIDKINIVHYNNLSVLFFGWALYFIVQGTLERRAGAFLLAGLLLGFNMFVRLPNVLGVGLVLIPLALGHGLRWRDLGAYALGGAVAVGTVLLVMTALGHLQAYVDAIGALLGAGKDPESHYGLFDLVRRPIKETLGALVYGGAAVILMERLAWLAPKARDRLPGWAGRALAALGAFGFGVGLLLVFPKYRDAAQLIAGVGYWLAAYLLFRRQGVPARARLSLVLGAAVVFVLNWGSDTGIAVSTYAFPILLAGVPLLLVEGSGPDQAKGWWTRNSWTAPLVVFLGALTVYGTAKMATAVYRDVPLGTTSSLSGVGPVFTSPQRAKALESMVAQVKARLVPGDELLAVDSIPLLHYLTGTRPYLENPWPALYTKREFGAILEAKARSSLPKLIVIAKANARGSDWPQNRSGTRVHEVEVRAFIQEKGFVLVEDDADAWYFARESIVP